MATFTSPPSVSVDAFLISVLSRCAVLDVPPDIGMSFDSAISAAENLKFSWVRTVPHVNAGRGEGGGEEVVL